MSAGRPGERAGERNRGRAGQLAGSDRASCLPQVLVQELEQYQVGPPPPRPRPRVPASPSRPASRLWWSPGRLSCLFPAVAEEVGLGGQRAQQELRGIGEQLPGSPRARAPSPLSAPVRAPRGRARGLSTVAGRPGATGLTPEGSWWRGRGGFGRKRSWGRRRAQAGAPLARGPAGAPGAAASHSEGRSHRSPF